MTSSKECWKPVDAVVSSVERMDGTWSSFGHFCVDYAYEVDSQPHAGQFRTYLAESLDFLHARDVIQVRYNPDRPDKSFYPKAVGPGSLRLMAVGAIAVGLGLLALLALGVDFVLRQV